MKSSMTDEQQSIFRQIQNLDGEYIADFALDQLPDNDSLNAPLPPASLVKSIKENGFWKWNPVALKKIDNGYEVIAGNRRIMAARDAGLQTIAAYVFDNDVDPYLITAFIENNTREDNPHTDFHTIKNLQEQGFTVSQISKRTGVHKATIKKRLRLSDLTPFLLEAYFDSAFTFQVALKISRWQKDLQEKAEQIVKEKGKITTLDVADLSQNGQQKQELFWKDEFVKLTEKMKMLAPKEETEIHRILETLDDALESAGT